MNTESAFFCGGWEVLRRGKGEWLLSVCVVVRYLSNTQHRSGVLLIKVAKVHPGRDNLDRELQQEKTRKQDGSVGALRQFHVTDHVRAPEVCFNATTNPKGRVFFLAS